MKTHSEPIFSNRNAKAVAICKEALFQEKIDYVRLYREKRKVGVDGHGIKFFGLCGNNPVPVSARGLTAKLNKKLSRLDLVARVHFNHQIVWSLSLSIKEK